MTPVTHHPEMSKDKRVTVTIKLTPGRDDDLIIWWRNLQKGTYHERSGKQEALKKFLRLGLDMPEPEQGLTEEEKNRLAQLESLVETLLNQPAGTSSVVDDKKFLEWADWTEKALNNLDARLKRKDQLEQEVKRLSDRVEQLLRSGLTGTFEQTEREQVTDKQLERRRQRLEKTDW